MQPIKIHPKFDQLLALQNPTNDLSYTDVEVASIAPKFPICQILPGSKATKTNLLEQYLEQLENADLFEQTIPNAQLPFYIREVQFQPDTNLYYRLFSD